MRRPASCASYADAAIEWSEPRSIGDGKLGIHHIDHDRPTGGYACRQRHAARRRAQDCGAQGETEENLAALGAKRLEHRSLVDPRPLARRSGTNQHDVHKRVSGVIDALKDAVGDRAPLVVIAHSLGGHVMSNYIYDAQQENKNGTGAATPIQRMETVAKFITFGCNIPVFVFAYPESDVRPIAYPGSKLPTRLKMKPWWYNYFDRDDVLGFPLRDVSPRYAAMANDNRLADVEINAGSILTSWNPLSHNAYWTDEDFYRPVALKLSALM